MVGRTGHDFDALSANEGVIRDAHTHLPAILRVAACSGRSEALCALSLGHCVFATGYDELALSIHWGEAFLANADLLTGSGRAVQLDYFVGWANHNRYAYTIHTS